MHLATRLGVLPAWSQIPLVNHSDVWRYRKQTAAAGAPQSNWKTVADSGLNTSWLTGSGGFGYADNATETSHCLTLLNDMKGAYSTLAMRKSFQVTTALDPSLHLNLKVDWDDGFVAFLDGVFLASDHSPGSPAEPAFNAVATGLHESSQGDNTREPEMIYNLGAIGSRLAVGTHVLSIVGLNQSLGASSDFVQVADLYLVTNNTACVEGALTVNTTWRATNSPIAVCGTITVNSGVTLTIEPGTTVHFAAGAGLVVANGGRVLAEGAAQAPIVFTNSPGGAEWDHVVINGSAGSPESRMAYVRFHSNISDASVPCIEVAAGTASLGHLNFSNNRAPYIHVDAASFIISDCVFPSAAVKFELVHGTGGIKSGGHGIFLRNYFGVPIGYSDVVDFTGGNRPSPIVHFIQNVFTGSQDDGIDLDGTDAWVEGNIFVHVHRNGDTPDSSAAVSGGSNSGNTSEVTIIGNLFFDCDNAATAKQGNFFALLNNTLVHITRTGGIDGASGAVTVRDTTPSPTTFARGLYLEANIIWDTEQLVRNYDAAQTTVTLNNNIVSLPWNGPGTNNVSVNPRFNHVPLLSETVFADWAQAQILRMWLGLQDGSPAVGRGPNGRDQGGVIPVGASVSGEPPAVTALSNALLRVGVERSGFGMPVTGWPDGAGYTHYKWRLDTNAWSGEVPMATPIVLSDLLPGAHYVEVSGKRDSGLFQDDPRFGPISNVTRSRTWTVNDGLRIDAISVIGPETVELRFVAQGNVGYTVEYRDILLGGAGPWQLLRHLDPIPVVHEVSVTDQLPAGTPTRFYRLVSP